MLDKKGNVRGLRLWKCLCVFDDKGHFNPEFDKECEQTIEGKQVYIAIGQSPDYDYIPKALQDQLTFTRGKIAADEWGHVEQVEGLFVGGDIFRGPDLISGVADGHRAAQGIDEFLYKKAKKKESFEKVSEMRNAVKDNTPKLTLKQRGIKK
jgi:glutamate synthase (NADPH/NADH) small chain